MDDDAELKTKLTQLAAQIVDSALGDKVPMAKKIAALKIAGSFGISLNKLKPKGDDNDNDNFGNFASVIKHAGTGAKQ
jgi:hypothetical protein